MQTNIFPFFFFLGEHTQETNSPHSLKKDVENMGKGKDKFECCILLLAFKEYRDNKKIF